MLKEQQSELKSLRSMEHELMQLHEVVAQLETRCQGLLLEKAHCEQAIERTRAEYDQFTVRAKEQYSSLCQEKEIRLAELERAQRNNLALEEELRSGEACLSRIERTGQEGRQALQLQEQQNMRMSRVVRALKEQCSQMQEQCHAFQLQRQQIAGKLAQLTYSNNLTHESNLRLKESLQQAESDFHRLRAELEGRLNDLAEGELAVRAVEAEIASSKARLAAVMAACSSEKEQTSLLQFRSQSTLGANESLALDLGRMQASIIGIRKELEEGAAEEKALVEREERLREENSRLLAELSECESLLRCELQN